ncbi:PLDc N-terminal domain-containing protein [Actibacterium sp. 188UL27-1]|uniref:PLDc N-terminal domain-containing protein n=1 Tax=Actibacterium sp. 188UL27-1 TaxID=2786961 RepID=UPI001958CD43|nr:PLDc N-terminal domain-containing protein [Actibacterium sp. 188UL27-1]MBM7069919.1 PLDc N-terminal domain-containing protein [Actibacterium sp. 188UL27-1]
MVEVYGLGGLIALALSIWAIVSIVSSGVSTGAKVLWVLFVLVLPIIGFIVWLLAGPRGSPRSV